MRIMLNIALALGISLPASAQMVLPRSRTEFPFNQKVLYSPVIRADNPSVVYEKNLAEYLEHSNRRVFQGSYHRSPTFDSAWAERFQDRLDLIISINDVPGASLAVYAPGQGLFTAVSGISTAGVPINEGMRFGVASNTKLFVAVALERLQEEGILTLDDPLYQWLPPYAHVDSSATIRQLLSHKSGFFDFWNDNLPMITDSIWADTSRFWTAEEIMATIGPPHFLPGQGYSYSNTNYLLAGLVMEAATGMTWTQILHNYILDPLQMDSTFVGAFENRNGEVSSEWVNIPGVIEMEITDPPMTAEYSQGHAAAAIMSTAQEMVGWYNELFNGNLLSPSSLDEVTDFDPVSTYGLGLHGFEGWGHPGYAHTGVLLGYLSLTWMDRTTGAILSILYNGQDFTQDPYYMLLSALIEDFPKKEDDAGIASIIHPFLNYCTDTITPVVVLVNPGTDTLMSAEIRYFIDEDSPETYYWTGSLGTDDTLHLSLPALTASNGQHTFTCYTNSPNGQPEGYNYNDTATATFIMNLENPVVAPYSDGFEGEEFPSPGWLQGSQGIYDWGRTSMASYGGEWSAVKNNYMDGNIGKFYDLDMPLMDISGGDAELVFDYAYARRTNYYKDSLKVLISDDCGESWDVLFNKGGVQLATVLPTTDPFIPTLPGQWREEVIALTGYTGEVLIRFRAVCGNGNNLYLDDVAVNIAVGNREMPHPPSFTAYPNPAGSCLNISGIPANSVIILTDLSGRLLISVKATSRETTLDIRDLPKGIYLLRTCSGNKKIVKL